MIRIEVVKIICDIMKLALISLDRSGGNPPLGLAYIAAYLRKYNNFSDTVIIDKEDPIKAVKKSKPDLIGISAVTTEFPDAIELAKNIKSTFDLPTIVGGVHISALPQSLPEVFDVGVMGEGEKTVSELVENFEKTGELKNKEINGLVFKEGNNVAITKSREPIDNLDTIPFPARDLLKMKEYYLKPRVMPFSTELSIGTHMLTSRGCPYRCVYCSSAGFWKGVRYNSPEYVVEEMKTLLDNFKLDMICLFDDLFVANKKRLEQIVSLIEKEKINEKIRFTSYARTNLLDDETCQLLKRMNIISLSFGFESGSQKILGYLKRNTVTVEQNKTAIDLCRKHGFFATGNFMLGNPFETKEDLEMTYNFLKDNPTEELTISKTTPFPNTELWEYAKERNIVSDSMDWKKLKTGNFNEIFLSEHLTKDDIQEYCKKIEPEMVKSRKFFKFKLRYLLSPNLMKRAFKRRDVVWKLLKVKLKSVVK